MEMVHSMDEKLIALQFYRNIKRALETAGIHKLIIQLAEDGQLEVDVYHGEDNGNTNPSECESRYNS